MAHLPKKRLLVLTTTFPRWPNDSEPPFVYELSRRLTNKFDVTVLTPHFPDSKTQERMGGINIIRFRYGPEILEVVAGGGGILPKLQKNPLIALLVPSMLISQLYHTVKFTKEFKPQIVHAHWVIPSGFCAYINKLLNKVNYVVTSHGSDLMGIKGFIWLKKLVLSNSCKITVVGNALRDAIESINPKLLSKTIVAPMGVDTTQFNPNKKDPRLKKELGIKGKFVLFIGRLAPEKGIDLLINAMPLVIRKLPNSKLIIIGEGPLRTTLEKMVGDLKLEENVIFLGKIANTQLPRYYASADVFVGLSRREGFGITFVEAIMCGCPVIGTNIGGIRDIVTDEVGRIVSPNSSKEISNSILAVLQRKKLNNSMAVNKYSWDNIKKKYEDVLNN